MSKVKKINKRSNLEAIQETPAYKKVDGTVTYIYNTNDRVIDWYTPYKNMQTKAEKYKNLQEK